MGEKEEKRRGEGREEGKEGGGGEKERGEG